MAGRSRTTVSASFYEDFHPQVERKQEQGADILIIHLPGFRNDQIKVTYVNSSRTVKVQGERALGKNRRSRLDQSFPVPQNCIIQKIQGAFRNGILTLTMPKQTIADEAGSAKDASATKETTLPKAISQQKHMKDQKKTTPPKAASTTTTTSGVEKQRDDKIQPLQTPQKAATDDQPKASMVEMGPEQIAPPKVEALQPSKLQEEAKKKAAAAIATTSKQAEEKTAGSISTAEIQPPQSPQKAIIEDEPKASMVEMGPQQNVPPKIEALQPSKLEEEAHKKAAAAIATTTKPAEEVTAGSTSTTEKPEIVEKKDDSKVGLKDQIKEKESGKSEEGSDMYETNLPKMLAKGKKDDKAGGGGAAVQEKQKEGDSSSFLEKAKEMRGMDTIMKTVKRLASDETEDRHLLINIGVSVLVIVAVGAYITYRYRSYGKAKG